MQNVIRYGDDGPQSQVNRPQAKLWMLTVSKNGDELVVMSGNYIAREDAQKMCSRIDELRDCTPEELRKIYKEKLRNPPNPRQKAQV